ncbi:hypothetical protein U0070_019865 [Myodes glareolus]|uniref:Ribosomal protein L26 n=1 Tax=Myodes glareolus TaxID=447135 RepID=A0AAW0JLE0_MYOGA
MMKFRLSEDTKKASSWQVVQVYRKKCIIYTEQVQRVKANGTAVHVGIHPSKMVITRVKLDKDRKKTLERKAKSP